MSSDGAGVNSEFVGGLFRGQTQEDSQGDYLALAFGQVSHRGQNCWINHVDNNADRFTSLANALRSL